MYIVYASPVCETLHNDVGAGLLVAYIHSEVLRWKWRRSGGGGEYLSGSGQCDPIKF